MQIHEITEGFWRNVGKGFVQGVTGADLPSKPQNDTLPTPGTPTRIVVTVSQPGQDLPSKYYKIGNSWTNELGQTIQGMKQKAYLDKLIPTHGRTEAIPAQATSPTIAMRQTRRRRAQI